MSTDELERLRARVAELETTLAATVRAVDKMGREWNELVQAVLGTTHDHDSDDDHASAVIVATEARRDAAAHRRAVASPGLMSEAEAMQAYADALARWPTLTQSLGIAIRCSHHAVALEQHARTRAEDVAVVSRMLDEAEAEWRQGLETGVMPHGARESVDVLLAVKAALTADAKGGTDAEG